MAIKSDDVRPTSVVKGSVGPVSAKNNDPKQELLDAMETYEESVKELTGGKVLMKMERDNASFITDNGVKFTRENPYQLVEAPEVEVLLRQNFRKAYPEEVKDFYAS